MCTCYSCDGWCFITRIRMRLLMLWWLWLCVDWKGGPGVNNFIASWSTSASVTQTGHWVDTRSKAHHRNWTQTPTPPDTWTGSNMMLWSLICQSGILQEVTGGIMVIRTCCSAALLINYRQKRFQQSTNSDDTLLRPDWLFYKRCSSKLMDSLQSKDHLGCLIMFSCL